MILLAPDGDLTISSTDDCALYARFDNRFARGAGDIEHRIADFIVYVWKRGGTVPELLVVIDTRTGVEHQMVIAEEASGEICVPWGLMS